MHRTLAASLAAIFALALTSPAVSDPLTVVSQAAITQQDATRFVVHSDRLGRDYEVVVQLPTAKPFLSGQKLAAIYALDGGYGLAGPNSVFLAARGAMAPAIVVSIDFLRGQPASRSEDFTHHPFTLNGEKAGGGGAAFEAFLLQDLRPFIEARYPADPRSSALFGHSLGAVFAANLFAENPEAFAGYIIGSVVVPRDPDLPNRVAKATAQAHGQRVFLAVGGDEDSTTAEKRLMRQGFIRMANAFRSRSGVTLETKSYPGENHLSYYPNLVLDGFRFVLPPNVPANLPHAVIPPEALARYTGTFDLPDGRNLSVKAASPSLLAAQVDEQPPVYLLRNGEGRFYAYTADLDVVFDARGLTLAGRGGAKVHASRR